MQSISRHVYTKRRNAGYSHEEALAYPGNIRYRDKIELPDGRWFPNLAEMARATGIDIQTLRKRRERNLHGAELAFEGKHRGGKPQVIQGIPFESQKDVAAHFGVEYQTYLARLRLNWTVEQAIGLAPKPGTDRLTIDGVPYPTVQALADAYGKGASTVSRHLAAGATPRQAVGLDPFEMTHLQDVYLVDGVPYDSIAKLADAYDKPYNTIYRRIRKGMDPKTAVTKPIRHKR